jgi:hypothetical protein
MLYRLTQNTSDFCAETKQTAERAEFRPPAGRHWRYVIKNLMYLYHSWNQENRIVFAVFYCLTFAASFDFEV